MRLPTDIVLLLSSLNDCGLTLEERERMRRVVAANEKVFRTVREGMLGHGCTLEAQSIDNLLREHLPANEHASAESHSSAQAPLSTIRLVKPAVAA